ncbi:MAG: hypothetical protein PHR26_01490 [Candidatus ainarchaeum sp.]|nr:hypothetical protein [Candidatus ainarchaeum sp.]MDD3976319.1 hypothetical protein [Candidatus ainarchaeum sp.]
MNKKFNLLSAIFLGLILFSGIIGNVFADPLDTPRLDITLLNQDPDPANPGEYLELRFKVVKFGNDPIDSLDFNLDLEHPFYFDLSDTSEKSLQNWNGQSGDYWYYSLYYKILIDSNALEGNYKIDLKYNINGQDIWGVKTFDIRIGNKENAKFTFGNLITSPVKLLNDLEEAEINIELLNIGEGDAENVSVEINFPEGITPTYSYSDRVSLGNILSSSSKITTFYIDISKNIKSGIYNAEVIVRYQDKEDSLKEYKEEKMNLEIPIKNKPEFEIKNIILSKKAVAGEKVNLKISLENIGSKNADSVSIRAFKDSTQPFEFIEKSDFIGNLKINEIGEGIISLEIDKDAFAKKYQIDLEIRSIDGDSVFIENHTIYLEIENVEETTKYFGQIIIGVILIILLVIGSYNAGKRKYLNKKKK